MKESSEVAKSAIFRQSGDPGISEKPHNRFITEDIYRRTSLVCSAITLILGTLAMIGWLMGIHSLASFVPGYIPIAPGAALAFILLGGAWYLYARAPSRWFTRIYVLVSVLSISLIALLNLIQFLTGANVGIEEYFTREVLAIDPGTLPAGVMFVFLGTGLIAAAGPEHFPLRLLVGPSIRALLRCALFSR